MKTKRVTACKDCPFFEAAYDDYEADCGHPDYLISPLIDDEKNVPEWCPLRKEPIKIGLDNENRS